MISLLLSLAWANDSALHDAMVQELAREQSSLHLEDAPPLYYLRYHLLHLDQVDVEASFGSLVQSSYGPFNLLGVEARVGSPAFDNTGFGGWKNGQGGALLPMQLTPQAVRIEAWRLTDAAYKQAVEQIARKQAQFTPPPDYPGDFEVLAPTVADDGVAKVGDAAALRALVVTLSGGFIGEPALERGAVYLGHEAGWSWVVDSDGTSVRRPVAETTLRAVAQLRTSDGMLLSDQALWTMREPDDLPAQAQMSQRIVALREGLVQVAQAAPLEDEYVGPVLFEGPAANDLFRYLLVPQVEGTPGEISFNSWFGKLGDSGNLVRVGRRVLPAGWSVRDDPGTDPSHPGSFAHDSEGTPAQAVDLVRDGIVRELLMSRVPRKGGPGSNGHARSLLSQRAQARASLLSVRPSRRLSRERLRAKALKAAAAYGRDWVLVVRRLQEPFSLDGGQRGMFLFGGHGEQPSLPAPVVVYKLTAKGETPLRGARFVGVHRFVLRDIVAAGPSLSVSYLASSRGGAAGLGPTGGAPTRITAPSLLVGELELVPDPGDPQKVSLLPPMKAP